MAAPKKPAVEKKPKCTAKLVLNGRTYEASGATVAAALEALKVPGVPNVMKATLTVGSGGIYRTRIMPRVAIQRAFSPSRITREVALKNLTLLFDGI
jgi:hypothetical protein